MLVAMTEKDGTLTSFENITVDIFWTYYNPEVHFLRLLQFLPSHYQCNFKRFECEKVVGLFKVPHKTWFLIGLYQPFSLNKQEIFTAWSPSWAFF